MGHTDLTNHLAICENESKLFYSKDRAPFLICLEVYRPEEILVTAQDRFRLSVEPQYRNALSAQTYFNMPITGLLTDNRANPFHNNQQQS